ncbi:MAG: DUF3429 domain-containing protein [Pseudomonadota bacterium]
MIQIPRSALILGLAGTIPFLWGGISLILPDLSLSFAQKVGSRFVGPYVQLSYGTVILAFMSGVLWGFATGTKGIGATVCYIISVIPALWAFFMVGGGPYSATINLSIGFAVVLCCDYWFYIRGLTPPWWMHLRILLTAIVVACLMLTVYIL